MVAKPGHEQKHDSVNLHDPKALNSPAAATAAAANTIAHAAENVTKRKDDGEKKQGENTPAENSYTHGAFHWTAERASAIALIPLISTQFVYGAHPICDGLLGVVLPYHIYLGFDSCITDYIPKRTYPRWHRAANWTLAGATGLVMWGCFEFNTNEIGLTEFIQRIWTA
ncbi:CybS-domain-containing protein [Syncephalastrum racemosum]|uniref:Succinate dehydrogenase [ubiquinone] cytochrome b small subunit n=1 Tax=Syncephalastrum racemosum TaxID=13706 RepID=A0A1X2H9V9_SYNRA|nr:CybS-domain-containing protein [Syncephalastrum racemosum]